MDEMIKKLENQKKEIEEKISYLQELKKTIEKGYELFGKYEMNRILFSWIKEEGENGLVQLDENLFKEFRRYLEKRGYKQHTAASYVSQARRETGRGYELFREFLEKKKQKESRTKTKYKNVGNNFVIEIGEEFVTSESFIQKILQESEEKYYVEVSDNEIDVNIHPKNLDVDDSFEGKKNGLVEYLKNEYPEYEVRIMKDGILITSKRKK